LTASRIQKRQAAQRLTSRVATASMFWVFSARAPLFRAIVDDCTHGPRKVRANPRSLRVQAITGRKAGNDNGIRCLPERAACEQTKKGNAASTAIAARD